MGFLSGITDALSSGISGAIGGLPGMAVKTGLGLSSSAYAQKQSLDAYGSRYQMAVADMIKAGLNPILAVSGGFNVGNAPQMQAPDTGDIASGASSARQLTEIEQVQANTDKALAETKESISRTLLNRENTKVATQQEKVLAQEVLVGVETVNKLTKEVLNLLASASRNWAEHDLLMYKIELIRLQAKSTQYKLSQLKNKSDVYDTPYFGQFLTGVNEILNSFNLNFSGHGSSSSVHTILE